MGNPQFPQGSPQAERVELLRVTGAVQAVNTCLPQTGPNDSGTAAATSGLINGCSTVVWAFSVLALQFQTFACWIWGLVSGLLTTVVDLQNQINNIQGMRTPGVVNIAAGVAAGSGASASIVGNDTAGQITLTTGTGSSSSGELFSLTNDTPFATAGVLLIFPANNNAYNIGVGAFPYTTTDINGSSVASLSGINNSLTYKWNYVVLGGT